MGGWLANITQANANYITITKPTTPGHEHLSNLKDDWSMLLVQFVLHKRLTPERVMRITGWDYAFTQDMLLSMLRSGIVILKSTDIYHIDPFVHPFVVQTLREKEVIK